MPIKLPSLQDLATKHSLPAIKLDPIPNEMLPQELREKQSTMIGMGVNGNTELYTMFAQSLESRGNVSGNVFSRLLCCVLLTILTDFLQSGIIKLESTPGAPTTGIVLVSIPKQGRLVGIVFAKVGLPDVWLRPPPSSSAASSSTPNPPAQAQQFNSGAPNQSNQFLAQQLAQQQQQIQFAQQQQQQLQFDQLQGMLNGQR